MKKNYVENFIKESLSGRLRFFAVILAVVLILKSVALLMPIIMGRVIDLLSNIGANQTEIKEYLFIFSALLVLILVLVPLQSFALNKFVQSVILTKSIEWLRIVLKKDLELFNQFRVGTIVNSTDRGIAAHEKLLGHFCESVIPLFLEFILGFVALAYLGGGVISSGILVLIVSQLVVSRWLIRLRRDHLQDVNDAEDDLAGELTEVLQNGLILQLEKAVKAGVSRVQRYFEYYERSAVRLAVSGSILGMLPMGFINLTTLFVLVVGLTSMSDGVLTVGDLVALIAVAGRLSQASGDVMASLRLVDQFKVDADNLLQTLNLPSFVRGGVDLEGIEQVRISPCEINKGNSLLRIKSEVKFKSGEKVAIIGPTGGGKSTLLNLIAGMSKEYRNYVVVDGVSLENVSSKSQVQAIRYCAQDDHLLSGKISESVYFNQILADQESEILKRLKLNLEISAGDKVVSEGAKNLSGGEGRRLAVSRVLVRPGEINLFDEPTTGLNDQIKEIVWTEIFNKLKEKIVICVTHDSESLLRFDRVISVDGGEIVYDGPVEKFYKVT